MNKKQSLQEMKDQIEVDKRYGTVYLSDIVVKGDKRYARIGCKEDGTELYRLCEFLGGGKCILHTELLEIKTHKFPNDDK